MKAFRGALRAASCSVSLQQRSMKIIQHSNFHTTSLLCAKIIENVPALGESITEGSVAQWVKSEGEKITADDVICIVETDKVTVDIKSTRDGVFLRRMIADDTVVVGEPLYEMDTDGAAAVASASPVTPDFTAPPPVAAASPPSSTSSDDHHSGGRVPSIKFLGKRSLLPNHGAPPAKPAPAKPKPGFAPIKAVEQKPHSPNAVNFYSLSGGAWYGRPKLSDAEMEAIESGGASNIM